MAVTVKPYDMDKEKKKERNRADEALQAEGDLSFSAGERIEIVERTDSAEDWWTGKVGGRQGIFPGNYTQVD